MPAKRPAIKAPKKVPARPHENPPPDRVHLDFTDVRERSNLWREFEINPDTKMACLGHNEASARWRYEVWFPLEHEPEIVGERLQIGAQVEWTKGTGRDPGGIFACVVVDAVSIVFRREGLWYAGGTWDWTPLFEGMAIGSAGNMSPEEVFLEMRTYAAALVHVGLTKAIWQDWCPGNGSRLEGWKNTGSFGGVRRESLSEVLLAIQVVSPTVVETIIRAGIRGLLETLEPHELEAIREQISTVLKGLAPMKRLPYWVPVEEGQEEEMLDLSNEGDCDEPWGLDRALVDLWAHTEPEVWGEFREKVIGLFGNSDLVRRTLQFRPKTLKRFR